MQLATAHFFHGLGLDVDAADVLPLVGEWICIEHPVASVFQRIHCGFPAEFSGEWKTERNFMVLDLPEDAITAAGNNHLRLALDHRSDGDIGAVDAACRIRTAKLNVGDERTEFDYNEMDLVVEERRDYDDDGDADRTIRYEYDAAGNEIRRTSLGPMRSHTSEITNEPTGLTAAL